MRLAPGATRLLGNVLFGVSATDFVSFARAIAIVGGGVVLAHSAGLARLANQPADSSSSSGEGDHEHHG